MPKVKRGRRHHYSSTRQKCYEQRWQGCNVKSNPLQDITNRTAAPSTMEDLNIEYVTGQIPQWHISKCNDYMELSLLKGSAPGVVKFSVKVCKNLKWTVRVYGRLLPLDSVLYEEFSTQVASVESIILICSVVEGMCVCEGNSDDEFISMIKSKGCVIRKDDVITAYYDENSNSIHHYKCQLLLRKGDVGKCFHCQSYRATLRAMKSRFQNTMSADRTSHNSHTNYRYLGNIELQDRLKNVQIARKTAERTITRLKENLKVLIDRDGIELEEEDELEMNQLVDEVDEAAKARNHFQKIFWEQQRAYNTLKNKRSMRWHPLMIRFALNLKYLSSGAYRAVRNFMALPSNRTLCDYTHILEVESGVNCGMIERLKKDMNFETCAESEKLVSIMMDEMKIRSGLVFNQRSGKIVGFVNLGGINNDLEALQSSLMGETKVEKSSHDLAGSMLVLMVRLLHRPSFTFPVAQHPTSSLSGDKLYPIVWDVIEALEMNDIQVMCVSCDGLSANRKFFKIGRDDKLNLPYKTKNPFDTSRNVYYFCDTPHLLKTTRNCFSNSFAHSNSRNLKVSS